jgi:hypothetical protein
MPTSGGGWWGGWGGGGADNDWPAEWENYGALGKYSRGKVIGKTPPYCLVVLSSNCYSLFNLVIFLIFPGAMMTLLKPVSENMLRNSFLCLTRKF